MVFVNDQLDIAYYVIYVIVASSVACFALVTVGFLFSGDVRPCLLITAVTYSLGT